MAPKFGATKFRNAVPAIPGREEWYRTNLTSDSAANTSGFSSSIKANREYIVTLSPNGDCSVRAYSSLGAEESHAWSGKLQPCSNWDLSLLEGGGLWVAGTDGTIVNYEVTGVEAPKKRWSTACSATCISAHPGVAELAVAGTANQVGIYDFSRDGEKPVCSTSLKAPLWSVAWSPDGSLLGGVTKKGEALLWDWQGGSRSTSRDLSTILQALKPVHVVFADNDLFVTSFSRSRTRQYSLFSAEGLSTVFTASVDTSQGPLLPVVDQERRIVYAVGRGDMTLRQIELGGAVGYQEMTHPLPSPTTGGIALAHWSTMPVMEAQIATVLLPTTDKDGSVILPLAIKVPRRQLIDYHPDLYPDPRSTIPSVTAKDYMDNEMYDRLPARVSMDPSRRGEWEQAIKAAESRTSAASKQSSSSDPIPNPEPTPAPAPAPASAPTPMPPKVSHAAAMPAPSPTKPTSRSALAPPAPSPIATLSTTPPPPSYPPQLEEGETYSSTSYKIRNVGDHILAYQKAHASSGDKTPLMVGLQGPQGCGKTTLCEALLAWLKDHGLRAAILSLDDLYLPHEGLKKVAADHPDNALLSGRGPPGTHDVDLAMKVLEAIKGINGGSNSHVDLPVFDKSLCDGEGDRSDKTVPVDGPLDVFILEGWSFGFGPLPTAELEKRYDAKDGTYFPQHSLFSLKELNTYLGYATKIYRYFHAFITVEPTSYEYVFRWRLQQEHNMKAANGGRGMSDEQVRKFIERYMPAYELWTGGITSPDAPWAGRLVCMKFGPEREVLAIETPSAATKKEKIEPQAAVAEQPKQGPNEGRQSDNHAMPPRPPVAEKPKDLDSTAPAPSSATSVPVVASPAPTSERYNPNWSRKYLAGKTPLNPTYDQVPPVVTLHQDSIVLRVTPDLALFPIDGPGGRVCVHPLSRKGRLPNGGAGYLSGGVGLADFVADQFSNHVVLAGEDGVLRVWKVGAEGIEGPGPEPDMVLKGDKMDKIAQIAFHPTAKHLLVVASNDLGKAALRFFDLEKGVEAKHVKLNVKGITSFAFSPNGDRVAIATKDSQIAILDPRDPSTIVTGKAHASPRSAQLTWIDDDHVLSLGFGRGSMRGMNLYSAKDLSILASQSLDISPAVLFPVYDPDTNILYVWGKGERTIGAYEIHPSSNDPISRLPAFTGSAPQLAVAFLPKTAVDVRKVEVGAALRLTSRAIEDVRFSIPRNRPQFFQDDIYVPTRKVQPYTTASAWLAGEDGQVEYVDLLPEGMTRLSVAPAPAAASRPKFVPAAKVMTEEEKKKAEMDAMFARAKDLSSDEEEEVHGVPPPDDDW